MFRRKPRLIDKITWGKAGLFLAKQAFKVIKDNVQHYRKRKR